MSGAPFETVPLSPTIGAELRGIDLAQPVGDDTREAIHAALLEWKVVFFRDQTLTEEQHLAFGRGFGELEVHPFGKPHPTHPELLVINHGPDSPGSENVWHSDVTWRMAPSLGSILYQHVSPPIGGDTLFADMYAAYDGLADEIKEQIDGRVAVHDFAGFRRGMIARGASDEEVQTFNETYPNPEHPVVRTHPETGRKAIYVNAAFTQHIVGMDHDESQRMLGILYRQATFPEYQCRFRWQPGSIAFWDNRACQHYATSDYFPHERSATRVTVIGDVPFFDPDRAPAESVEYPFRGVITRRPKQRSST